MINQIIGSGMNIQDMFITIVTMLGAMIIALSMHELAHGYVAYLNGDMTAKMQGRLTLNPLKHIDIFGFIALLFVGFGWAKPVPVDPYNFKKQKRGIFTVSIAGVTVNLILAIIFFILELILYAILKAVYNPLEGISEVGLIIFKLFDYFFLYGITINLTLMAFNLLPICPLDGFHVVEAFTRYDNKYCVFMRKYGTYVLFGLLIGGSIISSIGANIGGTFGRVLYYFDIIGLYINSINNAFMSLFNLIFGAII